MRVGTAEMLLTLTSPPGGVRDLQQAAVLAAMAAASMKDPSGRVSLMSVRSLIACIRESAAVDSVMPRRTAAVFPIMAHMMRNACALRPRSTGASAPRPCALYTALTVEAAESQFEGFAQQWEDIYPAMIRSWRHFWEDLVLFLVSGGCSSA